MNRNMVSSVIAAALTTTIILFMLCCGIAIGLKSIHVEGNVVRADGRTLENTFFSLGEGRPNPYVFSRFPFGKKIYSADQIDEIVENIESGQMDIDTIVDGVYSNTPLKFVKFGIDVPDGRNYNFVNDGVNENVSITIGENAHAGITDEELAAAPDGTEIRNASIAIGPGTVATNLFRGGGTPRPYRQQGLSIGWNAHVAGINGIAIGTGAQHTNETPLSGGGPYVGADRGIAIGYMAKSLKIDSVQIGPGTNDVPNSLKYKGVFIVSNNVLCASGLDTAAVDSRIDVKLDDMKGRGVMFGGIGKTNTYNYIRMDGYDAANDDDVQFMLAINQDTNSNIAASFPLYSGSPNRRDIYSTIYIDKMLNEIRQRITAIDHNPDWEYAPEDSNQ